MKSLSYLNKYFLKYKWRLLAGIFFVVAHNYFAVKMPIFLKDTIDSILDHSRGGFEVLGLHINIDPADVVMTAIFILVTFVGLILLKGIFLFFTRQTIIKVSRFIEYDLKNEIYDQYQRLDYTFYKRNNTGDLMNRISEDVSQVRMYLGPGIMYTVNLIVMFTMSVYEMININLFVTCIALLPLPIMSFLIYRVSRKMNSISTSVQQGQSRLSTLVQETFSGIRVVKAYSRETEVNDNFVKASREYKGRNMRLVLVNSLFTPTIVFLIGLSTVLSIYLGGIMSYPTGNPDVAPAISLGDITAYVYFVNSLTWPFASLGWVTAIIQRAAASQERINEFLRVKPEIVSDESKPFALKGRIEFRNVSYTYPNSGITAVRNLSFTLEPGETMAIVGRTASGKSTVLKLLMRQIDPQEGEILIDGKNLKDINLHDFRDQVGIVPQEVFLFSDTIANNIRFGALTDDVSEEELVRVTKLSHVYHNIQAFEDGFETLLGERGVNLSGGQKQRISISRALVRNPKLLLFDDCLSAVDTETEEVILSNLKAESQQKSSIIVSHRVSSLRNAAHIIVLDEGQKAEEGTHESLLELNALYAEMYQKQLAEENA